MTNAAQETYSAQLDLLPASDLRLPDAGDRAAFGLAHWLGFSFTMHKLTLIRGIPGSGKSTQARALGLRHHYEADMWFEQNGGYDRTKIKQAHEWCQKQAFNALASGESVVVANTFCRRWEMQPYLDAAKKHGAEVEIIVANGRWQNVHCVPPEIVAQMEARFES